MEYLESFIGILIIFFGVINLMRMSAFLIGSDIYGLKSYLSNRKRGGYLPTVSVVIPAYNEEKSIKDSVLKNINTLKI